MSASINYTGPYVFDAGAGPAPGEARVAITDDKGNTVRLTLGTAGECEAGARAFAEAAAIKRAQEKDGRRA